jgi:hypothetical protein
MSEIFPNKSWPKSKALSIVPPIASFWRVSWLLDNLSLTLSLTLETPSSIIILLLHRVL